MTKWKNKKTALVFFSVVLFGWFFLVAPTTKVEASVQIACMGGGQCTYASRANSFQIQVYNSDEISQVVPFSSWFANADKSLLDLPRSIGNYIDGIDGSNVNAWTDIYTLYGDITDIADRKIQNSTGEPDPSDVADYDNATQDMNAIKAAIASGTTPPASSCASSAAPISISGSNFKFTGYSSCLEGDAASKIISYKSDWIHSSENAIYLPISLTPKDITITQDNMAAWQGIAALYNFIYTSAQFVPDSTIWKADKNSAKLDMMNINYAIYEYQTTHPPSATAKSTIKFNPGSATIGKTSSVTITGFFGDYKNNPVTYCGIYVGDGSGTYWPKESTAMIDQNGNCSFSWSIKSTTTVGHHGAFILFTSSDTVFDSTYTSVPSSTDPNIIDVVQDTINVCAAGTSNCRDISDAGKGGTLKSSVDAVALDGTAPTLSFYFGDQAKAADYAASGLLCYFYVGNGKGGWELKTAPEITIALPASPNCSFQWTDFTGATVGDHGFIVNIGDVADQSPPGNPSLSPNMVTITVCAAGTTDCKTSGVPFNNGNGGGGGGGGGGTIETFDARIKSADIMGSILDAAGVSHKLDSNLKTPAGIFNFIIILVNDFIGLLGFIAIIVGGFMIMSGGNDITGANNTKTAGAVAKGKKSIMYGVIGLVVAFFSYGIVSMIVNTLNDLNK